MARQGQPLRDQAAVAVGERGGEVHVVAEHAGVGGAADGERHLVRDSEDGVAEELETEGVGAAGIVAPGGRARRTLSPATLDHCLHTPLPGWRR